MEGSKTHQLVDEMVRKKTTIKDFALLNILQALKSIVAR